MKEMRRLFKSAILGWVQLD